MFQRCLSVLLLISMAPVLVWGGEKTGTGPGDAPPAIKEARRAVRKHLTEIKAPRDACVLEATPCDASTVKVCVWYPGDDQPTRLPVMKTFAYAVPSKKVIQEE